MKHLYCETFVLYEIFVFVLYCGYCQCKFNINILSDIKTSNIFTAQKYAKCDNMLFWLYRKKGTLHSSIRC